MIMRAGYRLLISIAVGIAAFYLAMGSYEFAQVGFFQPVTYKKVEVLSSNIHAGDTITFRIYRTKRKICATSFDVFVLASDAKANGTNRVVQYLPAVQGVFSPIGDGYIDFAVQLSPLLQPGRYQFTEVAKLFCMDRQYTAITPPAFFTIEP